MNPKYHDYRQQADQIGKIKTLSPWTDEQCGPDGMRDALDQTLQSTGSCLLFRDESDCPKKDWTMMQMRYGTFKAQCSWINCKRAMDSWGISRPDQSTTANDQDIFECGQRWMDIYDQSFVCECIGLPHVQAIYLLRTNIKPDVDAGYCVDPRTILCKYDEKALRT